MATYQNAKVVNLIAGEDLRGDLYELLTLENDAGVGKVIKTTLATSVGIGVLAEDPFPDETTDGQTVPVALIGGGGVLKIKAGGTVTAGQIAVASTTAGRVVGVANIGALAVDQMGIGHFLESGVDGEIVEVLAMTVAAPHSV